MKKLIFVACLLVPLGLWSYGKLKPYYDNYKAISTVGNVIREIPLSKAGQVTDAFKQFPPVIPKGPVLTPPHIIKAQPVKPEHHGHLPFTHPKPAPLPKVRVVPVKPVAPKVAPPPPPLDLEPVEEQPVEFCALTPHCGYLQ